MRKFRTAYDYGDPVPGISDFGPSLAIQSAAEECDINMIIERANRGIFPPASNRSPQYGDFSDMADYQSAMNLVVDAQARFADLPSRVRDRFYNDPAKLFEFLADPANRDEAVKLGLIEVPPPQDPPGSVVEPVAPSPAP